MEFQRQCQQIKIMAYFGRLVPLRRVFGGAVQNVRGPSGGVNEIKLRRVLNVVYRRSECLTEPREMNEVSVAGLLVFNDAVRSLLLWKNFISWRARYD